MGSGSCICGDVKYTFTQQPLLQIFCHCLKCRKFSASTNTTFIFLPRADLQITIADAVPDPSSNGTNGTISHEKATAKLSRFTALHESGLNLTFHFCARCGTYIYKETDSKEHEDVVLVTAGTLNNDGKGFKLEDFKVQKEFYVKDRLSWVRPTESAEQCQLFV